MSKYDGHTPAPWKAGINYVPYNYDYCWVEIDKNTTISISPALKNEANARLIADAPMLLEQNVKMLEMLKKSILTCKSAGFDRATWKPIEELVSEIEASCQ